MGTVQSDFKATQAIWDFMQDDAFVRLLAGPIGSGKSVASCHELVRRAMMQAPNEKGERKTRSLIVRNTMDQLKSTTMKTWFDWFPNGQVGYYKVSDKTYYMNLGLPDGTTVKAEFCFNALDDPADVRKVLSLELTMAFINEAREIRPEIIDGILMRLRRYPSRREGGPTHSCAILDTNMPDEESDMFFKMEDPPDNWSIHVQPPAILTFEEYFQQEHGEPEETDVIEYKDGARFWVNPRADNIQHLDPRYYPDIVPGKTEDFIRVYLRCQYGRSLNGVPVYERTFNPEYHIADEPFAPLKTGDYPIVIGLDFGRTPAAVLMQRNVHGQLVVLAEETSENMGLETFLNKKLKPLLAQSAFIGCSFTVAPDPAGWAKQQIGEVSPVDILRQEGFSVVKPVTNDPARRIEAVERVLTRHAEGKPMFVVNPQCRELIKGFRYGYRYKVNRQGHQDNKPEKNEYSHCHDACQYGVMIAEGNVTGSGFRHNQRREIISVSAAGWT